MKIMFTKEQKDSQINKVEIEEDELVLYGDFVEGEGKNFIITGNAVIEGEVYHDFQIEFELKEEVCEDDLEAVMDIEWEWYDYLC